MRVFTILSALAVFALANPAPLGFEMGKATIDDVKAKYPIKYSRNNYKNDKTKIAIDTKDIELDSLTKHEAKFFFDAQNKLFEVSLFFNKNKFNELLSSLSKKYKLIKKTTDEYGETFVEFEDGDCIIELGALKQITRLFYTTKDAIKKRNKEYEEAVKKENERKQRTKENMKSL